MDRSRLYAALLIGFLTLMLLLWCPVEGMAVSSHTITGEGARLPQQKLTKARTLAASGDNQQALTILEPFIQNPDQYPDIYSDYLVILFWDGQVKQAISRFEALPTNVPRRPYLVRNMAKAYYDDGAFVKAAALYREVLEQTPTDPQANKGLLMSLMAAGQLEEALAFSLEAGQRHPEIAPLFIARAEIYFRLGHYHASLTLFQNLLITYPEERDNLIPMREKLVTGLSAEQKIEMLARLQGKASNEQAQNNLTDPGPTCNYLTGLLLCRDFPRAVRLFETSRLVPGDLTYYQRWWLAWAYFKTGRNQVAKKMYADLVALDGDNPQGPMALAYCLATDKQYEKALGTLKPLLAAYPHDRELYFAQAFVYEKSGQFLEAVKVYDELLTRHPDLALAKKLKIRALADMGATSLALSQAQKDLPEDEELRASLQARRGLDHLLWDEPDRAAQIIERISSQYPQPRYKYDYLVALAGSADHDQAVALFEELENRGHQPPGWVLESAAGSYLALEEPQKSLALSDRALAARPKARETQMGRFYALKSLRRWPESEEQLNRIDAGIPKILPTKPDDTYNPDKLSIQIERGWFLASQNRLAEAEDHFRALHAEAPFNLDVRSGLAHVYLWRGWFRKALEEFKVIDAIDPNYLPAKTGRIMAQNALALKAEARAENKALIEKYPRNRELIRTARRLAIEEMHAFDSNLHLSWDDDETFDIRFENTVSTAVNLHTRILAYTLWRRTWVENPDADQEALGDDDPTYLRRAGVGLQHIFNAAWDIEQRFSLNYDDGQDLGSYTMVNFTPDDYWSFHGSFDSFTTDMSKRARAAGITSSKFDLGGAYRESEWRLYRGRFARFDFSDGNVRNQFLLGYEQNLWVKNDIRMRLFLDLFATTNSKDVDAVVYYNPESAGSLTATHMTEKTVVNTENRAFIHRLFLTAGASTQKGYGSDFIGSVRYEQDIGFTDTMHLTWGAGVGRNVYDGDGVHNLTIDILYGWRF